MKKIASLFVLGLFSFSFLLTGCGGVSEKGPATEDSKTSPEMQAEIDKMQKEGMKKQFGDMADRAPKTGN